MCIRDRAGATMEIIPKKYFAFPAELLDYICDRNAVSYTHLFYKIVGFGLAVMVGVQVFLHIGGVTKMIPSTGITLPLISYGGSSVVSTMLIIGVIQGLHLMKQREVEEIEYAAAAQDEEDPEEDFEGRR